jgi:hypothetical protein
MQGTSTDKVSHQRLVEREAEPGPPATEYDSKMVMLRAERGDNIQIVDVLTRLTQDGDVPSETTVVKRTTPYFGPKLVLTAGDESYLLTAPGPDTQLLLWNGNYLDDGERYGWEKLAEVTAQFADDQPQYDLCPECGQPMQTIEHERKAAVGRCPGPDTQ